MTTIADFIGSHPLLILSHRGTDAFPGVLFPLEDGFATVGAPPGPGSLETGKDAHVIRGPWRISVDQLVVDDDRAGSSSIRRSCASTSPAPRRSACCCTLRSMFQGYSRSSLA